MRDIWGLVRQESEAEKYRNEDETNKAKIQFGELLFHREKHPHRKSSRTSSHEDRVEMQDIMRKYKVVKYVDKDLDDGETRHESRDAEAREHEEVQWTKHASRSDSQAQQHDITSRGGVPEERVYARCPQHMSTTTNTAQPQGLALCSRCNPAWASEGTPVGPGKDTHGTLGPCKRDGRGWPTTTAQRAKSPRTRQSKTQVSRQTW